MSMIILVDTSVFLNLLDVPGRNQNRKDTISEMKIMIESGDHLFLPMAAIFETGRHIAQLPDGNSRREFAQQFIIQVEQAIDGTAPWRPTDFPEKKTIQPWLSDFPDAAQKGLSLADLSIIEEWKKLCKKHSLSRVRIWSLDHHLNMHDRIPRQRRLF